ncbi:MAG: hypothetical protein AB2733_00595 [Candidatus Thiodiazotropha taylori]|nr:hypothetical protein [Candidatus Thiodiazotropha taylori]MCW4327804.1 hypothetical protein [Candidatus Thiodiazotropha taylori]
MNANHRESTQKEAALQKLFAAVCGDWRSLAVNPFTTACCNQYGMRQVSVS